jgi:NitT/TauT family transport system ATP-binding protein
MQALTASQDAGIFLGEVSKTFGNGSQNVLALHKATLEVRRGRFASLVGPSGCGKSTLLYILGGFESASSGMVQALGKPVTGPGIDRGVVFQEYALFPWLTVAQNIAYGIKSKGASRDEVSDTVQRYLKLMHLEGFGARYPRELSGGMRQRVALARTFAYQPDILLLDEPFGALDSQTRELMQDELLRMWQSSGMTVLMVTHDLHEAAYLSDDIYVMSKRPGQVVAHYASTIDHTLEREQIMLSPEFTELHNRVWLSVREQVKASLSASGAQA